MGNYIISNRSIKTLQTYWASPCNLSACLSATEEVECNMQRWRKVDIDRNIDWTRIHTHVCNIYSS
jgi:hypothetical protein